MLRQPDGSIQTSVYTKGTHTDHYLDYDYHHPLSHKKSVPWWTEPILIPLTLLLSSGRLSMLVVHYAWMTTLQGWPRTRGLSRHSQTQPTSDQTTQWKESTAILYIREVSEYIRRILSPSGIRVCYKPFQTLRQMLSHPKDSVPATRCGLQDSLYCLQQLLCWPDWKKAVPVLKCLLLWKSFRLV